jgi:hypothetical protein
MVQNTHNGHNSIHLTPPSLTPDPNLPPYTTKSLHHIQTQINLLSRPSHDHHSSEENSRIGLC